MRAAGEGAGWTVLRQFRTFFGVGLLAAAVHYGLLASLVEGYRVDPVPATVVGYVAGGILSYLLNRRLTYRSERPHSESTWRFAVVWGIGLALTSAAMAILIRWAGLPYLPAQLVTTGIVLFWSFGANRAWTFRGPPVPPIP